MTLTLLLDLDNTLLGNSMDTFLPAYLQRLARRLGAFAEPSALVKQLIKATSMMYQNQRPDRTLEEVFEENFYPSLGIDRAAAVQPLAEFYAQDFPELHSLTQFRPEAVKLIEEAAQRGYRVGIATAPLFPLTAIEQRLRWAGLDPAQHPIDLVPSIKSFHFSKPNPAYFAEFLGQMGWPDGPFVMVGDDLEQDITSAQAMGLPAFYIHNGKPQSSQQGQDLPQGVLDDLLPWIDSLPAEALRPDFSRLDSLFAILRATPAVLATLCTRASQTALYSRTQPDAWCTTEVVCHLRDVETEVNWPRFQLVLVGNNPFIPGRDTDEWATSRAYIQQDIWQGLRDFTAQRIEVLSCLESLTAKDWELQARHAIFGPTTLLELVKFIAEHDRLHIQQVYQSLFAS